jgi:integrase
MSKKGPVKGTFIQSGRYYLVRAEGKRRVWVPLTRVKDGVPAFLLALSEALKRPAMAQDAMPQVVAEWQKTVMAKHADKTQIDERRRAGIIAESFAPFSASEVRTPDIAEFLAHYAGQPRTHDLMRAQLVSIFRMCEIRGWRDPGTNPAKPIHTMGYKARDRYITDAEMAKIKEAAMTGEDGKPTRSGPMLCALIDMAVLTGQRIGDLLDLRWEADASDPDAPHIQEHGIWFRPAKVRGKTGVAVLVEWTPALRDLVTRLKALKLKRPGASDWVFIQKHGQQYTYSGASTAWKRATKRAGVPNVHFHDWRAKAITEKEAGEDMQQARVMAGHSTEQQTADYLRGKTTRKTRATR